MTEIFHLIRNPKTFRIWSPDELESNKLDAVLRDSNRNFQPDPASRNKGGRVIEVLSEHLCQGMLQGYTLTGRTGLFPSYESFIGIVTIMCIQYAKFNKMVCKLFVSYFSQISLIELYLYRLVRQNGTGT